jgi:hypothetical protein
MLKLTPAIPVMFETLCLPRLKRLSLFALLILFGLPGFALPVATLAQTQDEPPSTIVGEISDPLGARITNARISLTAAGRPRLATVSDREGSFRFNPVKPGRWILLVTSPGFEANQREIRVEPGQSLHLSIVLHIAVQKQQMTVSEEANESPAHNLGAVVLKGSDLNVLATNSTDLLKQIQAMAGGDPGKTPSLFVDGFTASRLPPESSIAAIRINQNPYSAQYDVVGTSRIEVITKPGGGQVHGGLNLYGDDSALDSNNPFVYAQPSHYAFYSDGSLSGPISKTASYFLTGDRQDVDALSFIHAVISPTGPAYTATVPSPQQSTDFGPRIDFQEGKVQVFSLRYQLGRQTQNNILSSPLSLASQAISTWHTDQTLQLSDIQTYGPRVVNETRFQYMHTNDSQLPASGAVSVLVQGAFNGGGNNAGQLHDGQNHYEFQDYVSLLLGDHLLRFGGRLRDLSDSNTSTGGFNGQYVFPSIPAYAATPATGASQYSATFGTPHASVNLADLGLYVEDEWKMRSNMTLNYGMRFETQNHIPDHADFAPRLSYAWSIGAAKDKPPKALVRAGIGVFYDRFTSDLVLNARRLNGVNEQQYVVANPDFYPQTPPPSSLGPAALPTTYNISPLLHAPYTVQQSVTLEKQFPRGFTASLDYSFYRGVDQLITRNVNAPLPGTYNPADPTSGVRPLGTFANVYQYSSQATTKTRQFYLSLRWNLKNLTLFSYSTLTWIRSDTGGPSSFPSNQYDLRVDYGRAANDERGRVYIGGVASLPLGFRLQPFLVLDSSMPFNITVGQDLNGDSQFNDRPAFATDLSRPSVYRTKWGDFDADPIPGQRIIPINYGTGPSLAMLNLGISRGFQFGPRSADQPAPVKGSHKKPEIDRRYQLSLGMEGQNILNTVNGGLPVGVLGSPLFGQSTSLSATQFSTALGNRLLYLELRLTF